MAITALPSADGQELTIQIQGRFDFGAHQDFRDAYERVAITPRRYVVDLRNATYLDSSALGMLLLLRDHAGGENAQISLANCSPEVRKISPSPTSSSCSRSAEMNPRRRGSRA